MPLLRVFLFMGLVLHKAVWEYMKRRDPGHLIQPKPAEFMFKRLLKLIKIGYPGVPGYSNTIFKPVPNQR